MKIECMTTFKDGRDTLELGDIRTVDDELGARFVRNGWATDTSGTVTADSGAQAITDLAINNGHIGMGDSNG